MRSPRERALARLKTLAAAGVVAGGCGGGSGYGVVDPMPIPACFENPPAVVTGKILSTNDEGGRVIEVTVKFQQTAKVTEVDVYAGGNGVKVQSPDVSIEANEFRVVFTMFKHETDAHIHARATCDAGHNFSTTIHVDESGVTVK